MSKVDLVRVVLHNLIVESQAPYTPDIIVRHFRATHEQRLSSNELLHLLATISQKRPNFQTVITEVTHILKTKDPMYALLVFIERFSCEDIAGSHFKIEMPSATNQSSTGSPVSALSLASFAPSASTRSLTDDSAIQTLSKSQSIPTSTPMNCRRSEVSPVRSTGGLFGRRNQNLKLYHQKQKTDPERADLSVIKERVLMAVSSSSLSNYRPLGSTEVNLMKSSASIKTNSSTSSVLAAATGLPDEYRTHMLWDYCKVDGNKTVQPELGALPLESQQRVLLKELIHCLCGTRGNFIVPLPPDANSTGIAKYETYFTIHAHLDKSLTELLQDILPLASYFIGIQKMMAATDGHGQVVNSLNAALQDLTNDFYVLVVQAEQELQQQQLTVQKLLYYLQPTIWVMEELWTTLVNVQLNEFQGAAVLTHLHGRIKRLEGDRAAQQIMINLTHQAAEPYMRMLQLWIQKGVIVDRNREFLVEDNEVVHQGELPEHYSDDYWEKRYTVRRDRIPSFLEKYSDKILRTGKYLNVIRQCGKRVMPTQQMELQLDPTNERHVYVINDAYYFAARMLLDVLLTENDLMGHLQSVKNYLLLNQGDFTMQFMDACEDELSKNVDLVLPMTLENLLGLTLRLSSARNDPYKDDLHCELLTYDLVTQMSKIMNQKEEYWQSQDRLDLSGLECFAFTYEVKWPVSLVLNHIAISKYQMLFRQLFFCKHVERQLCKIWKENSIAKKFSPQAAELYRSAFTLRQRMMNAIQNLEYYMMIEIIEPNWHIFIEKMKNVENVDNVLKLHQDFLDSCLKNCMLTESSHLNRAIFKLCKICLKFCDFIQLSQRFFLDAELKSMVCDSSDDNTNNSDVDQGNSNCPQFESSLDPTDTFSERVKRFDLEFTGLLISFLKQINNMAKKNTADRFMNLVHRINFNAFYSDQMEKLCVKDAMG
ncbi:gamma-tubulin complex component 2 homolog isoform X1 [Drosophila persimilis]|uniref:gamma-tubulin complex component 2 homolog isoform X1 n=1 Tax=Drosophila persimilis TaxID=7234 RepID=UPI000F07FCC3|nr:gamma-tubulin complex component 2 homolog isoform X1 [Drosophila persimilis]